MRAAPGANRLQERSHRATAAPRDVRLDCLVVPALKLAVELLLQLSIAQIIQIVPAAVLVMHTWTVETWAVAAGLDHHHHLHLLADIVALATLAYGQLMGR